MVNSMGWLIAALVVGGAAWAFWPSEAGENTNQHKGPLTDEECSKALDSLPLEWQNKVLKAAAVDKSTGDTSTPALRAVVSQMREAGMDQEADCIARIIDMMSETEEA